MRPREGPHPVLMRDNEGKQSEPQKCKEKVTCKNCQKHLGSVKGTVSQDFLHQVFSLIIFPQANENNIRVILNFFEKFGEIFASQGAPLVSTTLVANLPRVSTTPAADFATGTAGVVDGRQIKQYQTVDTLQ